MDGFPLKGYMLPLSPEGRASLLDPPPWHYGGDVMHLSFRVDPARVRALVPEPLELGDDAGQGAVWFVEWVSVSDSNPDLSFTNPERSMYRECIVMFRCSFKGEAGYYVPYIWVDNDFTLMRGFIQGFPKKLGRVHITRLHDLTPVTGGKKPGAKMKGICVSHEERIVEGTLVLKKEIPPEKAPPVRFYLMRHFPDYENPSKPLVHDITASIATNVIVGDAWSGDCSVTYMPSHFEELTELGPIEALGGFVFSLGLSITGGKVLHRFGG